MHLKHYDEKNNVYFITTVTKDREPVFNDELACQLFINLLTYYKIKYYINIKAFVIMPDHIHLIIQSLGEQSISDFMKMLKGNFTRYYNEIINKNCHSKFQRGFYDKIIRNEIQLNEIFYYIHNNPVKRGLVCDPQNYHYSSYKFYYENDSRFKLLLM